MKVHQDLVSDMHWYQGVANCIAGGNIVFAAVLTDATVAQQWGGFSGSTVDAKSNLTCTWANGYSGTPLVLGMADYGHSSDAGSVRFVCWSGLASNSAAFKMANESGANTAGRACIFIFGANTGTRHS